MAKVFYTPHAKENLKRLAGIGISEGKVLSCLLKPEKVEQGYFGRKIAQITLTDKLVLRVVYEGFW
ncbi:MAG: hypothetical protein ACUVTD_04895 [Nitrososphaerales archaeon]